MQARENLDPEYCQFMFAVAERLAGFAALPKTRKGPPPDWEAAFRDQRALQDIAHEGSVGGQMAKDAADSIEQLARERTYAIEWANRSVDSVKARMWALEDGLRNLVASLADTGFHNSVEMAAARKLLRDSDGSGEAGETGTGSTEGDSAGPEGHRHD
jgi:hypothetical protein